jgi:serine/threonine protein kinase
MGTEVTFKPKFGNYLLMKLIAKGGMAEIFRALVFGASGFSKLVAVKRILPHLCKDPQYVDMFINEARVAANLTHANIVQILDFGNIENRPYISMEYVHGKNLADIIQMLKNKEVQPPVVAACYIFVEALYGLDQAHRQLDASGRSLNLIHRDMSPHNIMVSYEGEVKIADFGIAKATQSTVHTVGGVVKGKHQYMSPEQVMGEQLDQRTDIFSMGICFYELLTLTQAFTGMSELDLLGKVAHANIRRPREVNPDIPERIEAILAKALAKERDNRYQTAAEWRDDLEQYLIEAGLRFSSSRLLHDFMEQIFLGPMQTEQRALAEEIKMAESMRPGQDTLDEVTQPAPDGSSQLGTLVVDSLQVKAASEPVAPVPLQEWVKGQAQADIESPTSREKPSPPAESPDKPGGGTQIGEPHVVGTQIGEPVIVPSDDAPLQSGRTELGQPLVEPPDDQASYQMSLDEQPYDDGESTDELDSVMVKEEIDRKTVFESIERKIEAAKAPIEDPPLEGYPTPKAMPRFGESRDDDLPVVKGKADHPESTPDEALLQSHPTPQALPRRGDPVSEKGRGLPMDKRPTLEMSVVEMAAEAQAASTPVDKQETIELGPEESEEEKRASDKARHDRPTLELPASELGENDDEERPLDKRRTFELPVVGEKETTGEPVSLGTESGDEEVTDESQSLPPVKPDK